jgi:hypothetical protein
MSSVTKTRLRRRILSEHGLQISKEPGHKKIVKKKYAPPSRIPNSKKMPAMRWHEHMHGQPIEELLMDGSLREVGDKLGISFMTVMRWRRKLNLNYSVTNLPPCEGCTLRSIICQATGTCHVLTRMYKNLNLNIEEVLLAKAKEVLSGRNN